jgi:hypothetical protein
MKKTLSITCIFLLGLAMSITAAGASLTGIYDFSDLDPSTTVFEGIDFDSQGNLWITSAPNSAPNSLLQVDLENEEVLQIFDFNMSNPVGLAIDADDSITATNVPGGAYDVITDGVGADSVGSLLSGWTRLFFIAECSQPEGATYMNGEVYVSCQNGKVFKVDPDSNSYDEVYNTGKGALGLGATDDGRLIIGGYNQADAMDRSLILYGVSEGTVETIDLNDLFVGEDSDYAALMGELYGIEIVDNGDFRDIPDPDGLAFRNGKIYMTFEHDLRVFEITLDAVPEPGTLLLLATGMAAILGLRRKGRK